VHAGKDGSRFCRNCGFRLDGVAQLLARNGVPDGMMPPVAASQNATSERKKGLRQGGKILFSSIVIFPLVFGLAIAVNAPGFLFLPLVVFLAGVMRMLYARLFQDDFPEQQIAPQPVYINAPPHQISAVPSYQPPAALPQSGSNVPTTGNLVEPPSITEQTTNLLNRS